jgi:hypothetical protein
MIRKYSITWNVMVVSVSLWIACTLAIGLIVFMSIGGLKELLWLLVIWVTTAITMMHVVTTRPDPKSIYRNRMKRFYGEENDDL